MFDFLRVAGLATLALGAAGASGEILVADPVTIAAPTVVSEPLPSVPAAIPLSEDVRAKIANEATSPSSSEPRAESLTALVRQYAAIETDDREQNCLASAIYFEAKGEPLDGQLAVAHVILNRAESGRFASTTCGVVFQRGQFSFVHGGSMPPIAHNSNNWRTAVAIAKIAEDNLWESTTDNALYFHARRVAPGWRMAKVGAIGNHVFYR
jgi:spore germination cell wall hydrolase CwlJ-like protein